MGSGQSRPAEVQGSAAAGVQSAEIAQLVRERDRYKQEVFKQVIHTPSLRFNCNLIVEQAMGARMLG